MRAGAETRHKGLIPIVGLTLLERNLHALLLAGFRKISIAVSEHEPGLVEAVTQLCGDRAMIEDAEIRCVIERTPLGTIGAIRLGPDHQDDVLVVNVDNLTALDLRGFVEAHCASGAGLTVAVHRETFRFPFGAVRVRGGRLWNYREKPERSITTSSGTYVVGPAARALIEPDEPLAADKLIQRMLDRDMPVGAFRHAAPWIDVNDGVSVTAAEALVREHAEAFECGVSSPSAYQVDLLAVNSRGHWLAQPFKGDDRYAWGLPSCRTDVDPVTCIARILQDNFNGQARGVQPQHLCTFDDIDSTHRLLMRHHAYYVKLSDSTQSSAPDAVWTSLAKTDLSRVPASVRRVLAWFKSTA